MSNMIKQLAGESLQAHVKSSKFCKVSSRSCVIGGKFGSLNLDLSMYPNATSCELKFKRISGNGFVSLTLDNESVNHSISSKVSEKVIVNLSQSRILKIVRPSSGVGDIQLLSVCLFSDESVKDNSFNLKNELKKCSIRGVKGVDNRYFANEGSKIESANILQLETKPPGMFKKINTGFAFTGLCEITKLQVELPRMCEESPGYVKAIQKGSEISISKNESPSVPLKNTIAFDYKPNNSNTQVVKDATILPGGMSVGRYGSVTLPKLKLEVGYQYILILSGKNVNGNGRLTVIFSGTTLNETVYIGDSGVKVPFKVTQDVEHSLTINRSGPSTGNVWISRIHVSKSTSIMEPMKISASITNGWEYDLSIDAFRYDIINFSKFDAETYDEKFGSIDLNFKPCTYSMSAWVSKFANLFDGISVDSNQIKNCNFKSSDPNTSILLTDIKNLFGYRKIMLEEFNSVLDKDQIKVLSGTDVIFTTSLVNAQYLRSIPGLKRVLYVPKYWPYKNPDPRQINEKYNLLISRSIRNTLSFVSRYNSNKNLVVVGYRGKELDVKTFGEHLPYSTLLSLIYHADCVIDFPDNIHYYSGLLDFALVAKKGIITTNNWLSICKPKVGLIDTILNGNNLSPDFDQAVKETGRFNGDGFNIDMNSYNNSLKSSLMIMREG